MNNKITIIGAGNVATHLAKSLHTNGFDIVEIFSQNINNAKSLAKLVNAKPINTLNLLNTCSDLYLICIKDDAIDAVLKQLTFNNKLIAHTSGSISMEVFKQNNFKNYGILYPLQTFSKFKEVNLSEVPFCIEGNNNSVEQKLSDIAIKLSKNVHLVNSEQRKKLHIAAVFACNFTNYMYTIAYDITSKNDINFDILKPLIKETASKIADNSPASMQTGPAKRNDDDVIKNHLEMLSTNAAYHDIYKLITTNIINDGKL